MKNFIYLDNAATTQVKEAVLQSMLPFFREIYGNPSADHGFARKAKEAVEKARVKTASLIGAKAEEIYFTAYPAEMKTIYTSFQNLMEFMLTKLDHSDAEAIHIAYGIYEKTLNGNYSISDIRNAIIEERQKKVAEKPVDEIIAPISQPLPKQEELEDQD